MVTVVKKALGIDYYWGRVEFAPGRGAIHLHIIGITRGQAYLQAFYQARTSEGKGEVLDKYAQENLDMTADVNHRRLAEDCMCHQCNNYCLQLYKTNALRLRTCQVHFGTESAFGKMDTQGLSRMQKSRIITNKKGISHFRMTQTESVRVVQHSRYRGEEPM